MTSPAAILFAVTIDSGTLWTDKENALSLLARFTLLLSYHVLFRVVWGNTRKIEIYCVQNRYLLANWLLSVEV